jgi:HK97 family phage portal protein
MRERFAESVRGRQPLVTGADWAYNAIAVNAEESQFLDTIKATATQIAAIYGVPAEMVGGDPGGSMTYANVEQSAINFATFTLRPWVTRIEQALSALMPRSQYVRFNVDAMIRTDMKSRYEVYQIARNIGAKNIDEIRALEDETPLPDGKGQDYTPLARSAASGESR